MTPVGAALDDLVTRLSALGAYDDPDEDIFASNLIVPDGDMFASNLIFELLATPFVWPLDDYLYEMLLEFSGLCLDNPDNLEFAVSVTCFLLGTGGFELKCSHEDDPSPLCARVTTVEDSDAFQSGQESVPTHTIQTACAMRKMRIELAQPGRNLGRDDGDGDQPTRRRPT